MIFHIHYHLQFCALEINEKVEAVERKYQVKLSNAEDDFKYKLKERELEFDELMNRKNGVSIPLYQI